MSLLYMYGDPNLSSYRLQNILNLKTDQTTFYLSIYNLFKLETQNNNN